MLVTIYRILLSILQFIKTILEVILNALGGFIDRWAGFFNPRFAFFLTILFLLVIILYDLISYREWVRHEVSALLKDKLDTLKSKKSDERTKELIDIYSGLKHKLDKEEYLKKSFVDANAQIKEKQDREDLDKILAKGWGRGLNDAITFVLVEDLVILVWNLPVFLNKLVSQGISVELIRWIMLFGSSIIFYSSTKKYGGYRGFFTYLGHISILLLGWLFGHWTGVLFISMPLLAAFYYTLYHLAMAIVPMANPDSPAINLSELRNYWQAVIALLRKFFQPGSHPSVPDTLIGIGNLRAISQRIWGEKWQRFMLFIWYLWGVQFPILEVSDRIGRNIVTRIDGSPFKEYGVPGLILAHSNQAVGLTNGTSFSRADGPGAVFTHPYERPIEALDLRTQLRSTKIEAVTKDGTPFSAILFTSFSIDGQDWSVAEFHRLRKANPLLAIGNLLDHKIGNYPYNQARIQAALSTTVLNSSADKEMQVIHWDDWALSRLVETTRLVLSQRNLDELWRPRSDGPGKSALDEIADDIRTQMAPRLREHGIHLFAARVVNYDFPDDHPIVKQQIATWSSSWEKKATETLADGQAEAERLKRDAKAYARTMFLTLVAEGLQKARQVNEKLPNYVIAMRVIGAMEELLNQQPEAGKAETLEHLKTIKQKINPHP